MVKEYNVPQLVNEPEAEKEARFDLFYQIVSETFTKPKYTLSKGILSSIIVRFPTSVPLIDIEVGYLNILVNVKSQEVYSDARKVAEELEKRLGIDVVLRTMYPLEDTPASNKKPEPKKSSLLRRILDISF